MQLQYEAANIRPTEPKKDFGRVRLEDTQEPSLRDQFAMAALQGMLARENSSPAGHPKTARGYSDAAYEFADQMLAARGVQ